MEDEPVKHKILDLLGDLALIGPAGPGPAGPALPALDIEIRNGGHRTNHLTDGSNPGRPRLILPLPP